MKSFVLSLTAASCLAVALAVPPALAGAGHGPQHGGVVREVQHVAYELVATPDSLTLHVSDHGKPVSTKGGKAEAVIYAGNQKTAATLEQAGENLLVAKGSFKVGVGVRVVLTTTLPGKTPAKATFNLK